MDKTETREALYGDLTRESLIALSYAVPVTDQIVETSIGGEKLVEPPFCDGLEKYRSELISISYSPSPKALPSLLHNHLNV